jgi:hypothetical protein
MMLLLFVVFRILLVAIVRLMHYYTLLMRLLVVQTWSDELIRSYSDEERIKSVEYRAK